MNTNKFLVSAASHYPLPDISWISTAALALRDHLNSNSYVRIFKTLRTSPSGGWSGVALLQNLSLICTAIRSSLRNRGVKQFDHCISAIPNSEGGTNCGHGVYEDGLNTFTSGLLFGVNNQFRQCCLGCREVSINGNEVSDQLLVVSFIFSREGRYD